MVSRSATRYSVNMTKEPSAPTPQASGGRFQSPEVRRRQILDAAAQLAVSDGLENTSIAKVAAAAGVAKGSIYLHFASRQDLVAGLQGDLWVRMLDGPAALVSNPDLTWTQKLDGVVEHWMRFEFDQHGLYHAVFHAVATNTDEPLIEARRLLGAVIAGGLAAGEFDLTGLDVDVVVEYLLHGYVGPCFHDVRPATAIVSVQLLFRRCVGASR